MVNLRIGNGYDVHRLAEGYDLWLGGIKVEHTKGSVVYTPYAADQPPRVAVGWRRMS